MTILRAFGGRFQLTFFVVVVFMAGFAAGNLTTLTAAQPETRPPADVAEDFAPFWQALNLIRRDYINPVDIPTLVDGAIQGMTNALGDQYSGYVDATAYPMMVEELEGELDGIGVVIRTNDDNQIEIVGVLNGTPAQAAGLLPGDIFLAVNSEDVRGMSQLDFARRVRGPEGTTVDLTILRGRDELQFTVARARIIVPNVETTIIEDVAHIKLNQFSGTAAQDLRSALEKVNVNQLAGLVLDMRDNPGGYLSAAVDVASLFIDSGPIAIEDFGGERETVFNATGNTFPVTVPMVVLVNESSASASELVAGALQDTRRATIIGESTLGKGTVQVWHELVNGAGLRLTIARWLTPQRRWIQERGITPDVMITWTPTRYNDPNDPQLNAAVEYVRALAAQSEGMAAAS